MKLSIQNQLLLTVIWLRLDPTYQTLGFLFGVSDTTAGRVIQRWLPVLEAKELHPQGLGMTRVASRADSRVRRRRWNSTAKWRVCACRW
ncbi:MAG: helix-turn-helix domain-containing protein, partial [Candidatus Roseilinea sp.]|uniref:helix-turn-helix domain-containing protein n=1 Tax=Candidatus Roseilinea sp. TaxID=2838777 RepID=UPI00404B817C